MQKVRLCAPLLSERAFLHVQHVPINNQDVLGWTALHYSVFHKSYTITQLLLESYSAGFLFLDIRLASEPPQSVAFGMPGSEATIVTNDLE